jgi:hypothetical protein
MEVGEEVGGLQEPEEELEPEEQEPEELELEEQELEEQEPEEQEQELEPEELELELEELEQEQELERGLGQQVSPSRLDSVGQVFASWALLAPSRRGTPPSHIPQAPRRRPEPDSRQWFLCCRDTTYLPVQPHNL